MPVALSNARLPEVAELEDFIAVRSSFASISFLITPTSRFIDLGHP